jgi:porphobilinogen synthase
VARRGCAADAVAAPSTLDGLVAAIPAARRTFSERNAAMSFPRFRMRRLRANAAWRSMVAETTLAPTDFVYPMFAIGGERVRNPISSMPGVAQLSVDNLVDEARAAHALGVPAVILFGIPDHKDPEGSSGYDPDGIVPRAIRALKKELPTLLVWADVCMCEYTSHGHCGLLTPEGSVDNDATLPLLARAAVAYARAGADAVAPSDMMDGRVAAIRAALDAEGFANTPIVAYAAKFASGFYGPFREAAESTPAFGDRRGYQMDPPNGDEAIREVALDVEEGADIVMVKPAGPYLDVIRRVKETFRMPTAAYQVSGEYSLIKAAAERGWIDERRVALESLIAIRRAGADIILTYYAVEAARWLAAERA